MVLGNGSHDESQMKRGCLGTGEACEKSSHTPHKLERDGLERLRENHEENRKLTDSVHYLLGKNEDKEIEKAIAMAFQQLRGQGRP